MSEVNILSEVKTRLGITGTYQDGLLNGYIDDVKAFLKDAGVPTDVIESNASFGVIARGVSDTWNYGSGDGEYSKMFFQRAEQLRRDAIDHKPYKTLDFVKDYFYEISFDNIDYDFGYAYMKEKQPIINGGCSAVRNGNWYGRNLDWTYDENNEFLVRTKRTNGRYASIGFSCSSNGLTGDDYYKIIPFMMLDGINECGVIANTNVVPCDKGITSKTTPLISEEIEICSMMLVRYILDHFVSANEAVNYIKNYMSVYVPTTLLKMGYETHLMVADENETYLVEFYGNETVVTEMDKAYMTNFYLSDVTLNDDGTVYTPASDGHRASENNISDCGSGLERYNLIVENYDTSNTKDGMRELMNKLKYTKAYDLNTEPFWFTEFVGINGLTVDSQVDDFSDVVTQAKKLFDHRIRNGKTWHTTHSVVYDIANRELSAIVQEDGEVLNYAL